MKTTLIRLGLLALMISLLAGCSGNSGSTGSNGIAGNLTKVTNLTADEWQTISPTIDPASISINMNGGKPIVKFTVTDENGNPLIGLGGQALSAANATAGLPHVNYNLAFTLAKLVPVTGGPSKWVNYLVTSPKATGTANGVVNGGVTWLGNYPQQEREGTLVDNGDGSYQYTFFRDITQTATIVAALTEDAAAGKLNADLGDTTYDGSLTHRLGIILSGSQPGTGTNTTNAVQVVTPVPLVNTFNIGYDFVPNGGAVTTTRDIVTKDSCTDCHAGRGIGHISTSTATNGVPPGKFVGRNDPRLCVTCHTDQTKYSFVEVTKPTSMSYSGNYARVNGEAAFTYPRMIHQTHMGQDLLKTGYNLNNHCSNSPTLTSPAFDPTKPTVNGAQCYNLVGFPQDHRDCTKCHDGSATKSDGTVNTKQTKDGDNWKNVPNRLACGACHDGINFADGTGTTLAGATTGHAGGAQTDDTLCSSCHTPANIMLVHETTLATLNNPTVQAGVSSFAFDISSVTLNGSNQPVIKFQVKQAGVVVTSFNIPTLVTNAKTGQQVIDPAYEPITGFAGGPTLYAAYAVPEDGIAAPADFNTYQSASLASLLIASGSPKAGTITGSDVNGYFTATLTGDLTGQPVGGGCVAPVAPAVATCVNTAVLASPIVIPVAAPNKAVMLTGVIIGSFTQKGLADYPYTAANVSVNPNTSASGGLNIPGVLKKMVATGYTARRVITDMSKCNTCHDQLGTNPPFHGQSIAGEDVAGTGPRNDPTACNICHNGNRTSNGWTADSSTHIHGIHGATKRSVRFSWAATSVTDNFSTNILFPGKLYKCDTCHLSDTVNFAATGGADVQANLLWSTTATGVFNGTVGVTTNPISCTPSSSNNYCVATADTVFMLSPYVTTDNVYNYGNNFSYTVAGASVSKYTKGDGTVVAAHTAVSNTINGVVAGTGSVVGGEIVTADSKTLVNSPMSSACFACHDTALATTHMESNGGFLHRSRAYVATKTGAAAGDLKSANTETCLVCHGKGRVADVAAIHK